MHALTGRVAPRARVNTRKQRIRTVRASHSSRPSSRRREASLRRCARESTDRRHFAPRDAMANGSAASPNATTNATMDATTDATRSSGPSSTSADELTVKIRMHDPHGEHRVKVSKTVRRVEAQRGVRRCGCARTHTSGCGVGVSGARRGRAEGEKGARRVSRSTVKGSRRLSVSLVFFRCL